MTQLPRLLDSSMKEVRRISPYDGSLSLNIIPLSTASLTVNVSEGIQRGDWIEMFTERGSAGIFRVRSGSDEYSDELTTLELDHAVAEIGDFICDEKVNESSTFSSALTRLFGYYKGSKWALSAGSYSDSVVIDINHDNLLEAMLSIMEQHPQYYMAFDFSTTPWRIRIRQRDTDVSAEGRLSRNITSASVEYDDSELYTKIVVEYGDSGSTKTKTIQDNNAISRFGIHEYFMSQSGYTEAQATTAANTFLGKHKNPAVAISINGVDLSVITGEALDTFELGKLYRLTIPKHGIVVQECITALNWSSLYSNPNNISISLADVEDPVVKFMKSTKKSGGGTKKQLDKASERYVTIITETQSYFSRQMHDMQEDLHSEIIQTASEIRTQVWASKSELYSSIMQTATNIYIQVGNAKSGLYSSIESTASSINLTVSKKVGKSEIISCINQTPETITISASRINLEGYVTASNLSTAIGSIVTLHTNTLYADVDLYYANGLSYKNGVWFLTLSQSGNTYTLKSTNLGGQETTIGSFSRATSLSGAWSGGSYTVTASPQGNTIGTSIGKKSESWDGTTCTVTVGYENPISGAMISTGCSFTIDGSSLVKGWEDYYDSSYWQTPTANNSWKCKVPKRDGSGSEDWTAVNTALTTRYNNGVSYANSLYTQWKSGNQSLYYWDTDSLSYKQATGSGKLWYYK